MTNTDLLREKIVSSGLKLEYIAKELGISRFALSNKIQNNTEFKVSEMQKLCEILKIDDPREKEDIFFVIK